MGRQVYHMTTSQVPDTILRLKVIHIAPCTLIYLLWSCPQVLSSGLGITLSCISRTDI